MVLKHEASESACGLSLTSHFKHLYDNDINQERLDKRQGASEDINTIMLFMLEVLILVGYHQ